MSVEIKVPQLGESIVEATVGRWLKRAGEAVADGEPVVELETEKVNMEVVAPQAGILESIVKREGETVGLGEVLAVVGASDTADGTASGAVGAAASGTVAANADEPRATPDDAESEMPSHAVAGPMDRSVTPLARRMAAEHGLDPHRIKGSGTGGRVTQGDVTAYLESQENGAGATLPAIAALPFAPPARETDTAHLPALISATAAPHAPKTGAPAPSTRGEERIRMSRRRLTIARRLVEAQQTAAMLTTFNEVDMSAIMDLRKRRRDAFKERHGVGLGFMSFFSKAVIGALKAVPRLNAEIQGDEMVLKHYYDLGIAVSTEEGLVVPVVRDADRLTFAEVEHQIAELAEKARTKTLSLQDLNGGTFTITNGGVFGSLLSTPILNTPQVGILGMHKIQERPIALNGQVVIHPMMYVALSYDHRIVDGSEAVTFLVRVKDLLEDPETLLLEG